MWEEQAWRGVKVCPCACTREFKVWKQNRDRNLVWGAGEIVLGCGVVEEKRSNDCPGLYHLEGRELRTGQESELPEPALGAEAAESLVGWSLWGFPPGVLEDCGLLLPALSHLNILRPQNIQTPGPGEIMELGCLLPFNYLSNMGAP